MTLDFTNVTETPRPRIGSFSRDFEKWPDRAIGNSQLPTSKSQFNLSKFECRSGNSGSRFAAVVQGVGRAVAVFMGSSEWQPKKPFDLRERLFDFGLLTIRVAQFLHTRGPIGVAVSYQILNAGTSAGANYEEADDGSSVRDSVAKKKIVLRELRNAAGGCAWSQRRES